MELVPITNVPITNMPITNVALSIFLIKMD